MVLLIQYSPAGSSYVLPGVTATAARSSPGLSMTTSVGQVTAWTLAGGSCDKLVPNWLLKLWLSSLLPTGFAMRAASGTRLDDSVLLLEVLVGLSEMSG
jgi:hypothetical protein